MQLPILSLHPRHARRGPPGLLLWLLCALLTVLGWSGQAAAYPWMIRHEGAACSSCHLDPSGAGILNEYGRAQSELVLRSTYGTPDPTADPTKLGGFVFGQVPLPEALMLQFDGRSMLMASKPPTSEPTQLRYVMMQSDAAAALKLGRFVTSGRLGMVSEGALGASVVNFSGDPNGFKLVAREYWAGVQLGAKRQFLLRAGRINLPFGLRTIEHTLWARQSTRTDINSAQQHGVAFAYAQGAWRGEAMAILGNAQLRPMSLHEYGSSAYLERALHDRLAIGWSSLVTYTPRELAAQRPATRQAHGVFMRYAPIKPLVLSAELDLLLRSPRELETDVGAAAFVQADLEPWRGLHVIGTLETQAPDLNRVGPSYGAWAGVLWFFLPHADVRIDGVLRSVNLGPERVLVPSLLAQFHVFL